MKKIAVFVSGPGDASRRIIKLFNDGNRIHTELVVAVDAASEFMDFIRESGVTFVELSVDTWQESIGEVKLMLEREGIELGVDDGFVVEIPRDIINALPVGVLKVSGVSEGPREVVEAFRTSDNENRQQEQKEEEERPKTMDEEWADSLQINFDTSRIPQVPPEVPVSREEVPDVPVEEVEITDENPPEVPGQQRLHNPYHGQQQYYGQQRPENPYYGQGQQNPTYNRQREYENHEPMPPTYLIWSILITILCCFIPGIVAIIFSSQVSSRYYAGDYEGARRASRNAEIWIIVSFVLGVLSATLWFPIMLIN